MQNCKKTKKWVFRNIPPVGPFTGKNFELVEEDLKDLQLGEFLVEAEYINLRPSLRSSTVYRQRDGDTVYSDTISIVIASRSEDYPVGTYLTTHLGWQSHTILNAHGAKDKNPLLKGPMVQGFEQTAPLMDLGSLPVTNALSLFGTPGLCAYFAVHEVLDVQPDDVVYVSSAAGGVGSIGGQLAKIRGARVIGSTSSQEKCKWLKELGFSEAINYKTKDLNCELRRVAPAGLTCFLDIAGGDSTAMVIINHMKNFGRVCIAGATAYYSDDLLHREMNQMPKNPAIFGHVMVKQLKIQGIVMDRWEKVPEAIKHLMSLAEEGKLVARDHVTEGFENIPASYIDMMKGKNLGKAMVKVNKLVDDRRKN